MQVNRPWRLAARPVGPVKESDFEWRQEPVPAPGKGELPRYRVEVVDGLGNAPQGYSRVFGDHVRRGCLRDAQVRPNFDTSAVRGSVIAEAMDERLWRYLVANSTQPMRDTICLVTGATSGIGQVIPRGVGRG